MSEIKHMKDASIKELEHFNDLLKPILKMVRKYWECDVKPKGYDKFVEENSMKNNIDFEFEGFRSSSNTCPSIEEWIGLVNTACSDVEQGRDPLETLLGAVLSYGMFVEQIKSKKIVEEEAEDLKNSIKSLFDKNRSEEDRETYIDLRFDILVNKLR